MRLTSIVHILSSEADNCSSWISERERMTVENHRGQLFARSNSCPSWMSGKGRMTSEMISWSISNLLERYVAEWDDDYRNDFMINLKSPWKVCGQAGMMMMMMMIIWWWPSWISELNDFSNSEPLCSSDASHQVSAQFDLPFGRCHLKNFKMATME